MREGSFDPVTDPNILYSQYEGQQQQAFAPAPLPGSVTVTTINGVTGPTVTFTGGTTGLTFTGIGTDVQLGGTLDESHGGTGQSSYTKGDLLAASAATTLSKLATAANNARLATDSSTLTGLIWLAASTGWGAASGTLSRAAYASYAGQTVSNPPTQAEMQALDDAVRLLSRTVAALITDLRTQKIINT